MLDDVMWLRAMYINITVTNLVSDENFRILIERLHLRDLIVELLYAEKSDMWDIRLLQEVK